MSWNVGELPGGLSEEHLDVRSPVLQAPPGHERAAPVSSGPGEDGDALAVPILTFQTFIDSEQFSQEFRLSGETDRSNWQVGFYYLDIEGDNGTTVTGAPPIMIFTPARRPFSLRVPMILFISDNGANGNPPTAYPNQTEEFLNSFDNSMENRGLPGSFVDPGPGWSQASMAPSRMFKGFPSEGGIKAPMIIKSQGACSTYPIAKLMLWIGSFGRCDIE